MRYFLGALGLFFIFALVPLAHADTKVYFSPDGGCQGAVLSEIAKARKSIDVAMYSLTSREIAQALVKAKERNIKIRIILDRIEIKEHFSKGRYLVNKKLDVKFHLGPGLMHNKFAVIDDRVLLTGSFNWTVSADRKNAENLLVLTDRGTVQKYAKQFKHLWGQSGQGEFNEKE